MGTLVSGRLSVAAGCLGVIEDCLAEAIEYAKTRQQHGKAIAKHQLVQEHIAHIEMDRVASEALVLRAAEAKDASAANPDDKELARQADLLAAQAKFFAVERGLGRRRPRRAGLRRPRLDHALPPRPAPHGRPRLPHLRGDRRDSEAEDRRRGAGEGIGGVQVAEDGRQETGDRRQETGDRRQNTKEMLAASRRRARHLGA